MIPPYTKKKKTKLLYVLNGRFPTEKANGYHFAQMTQEFKKLGISTLLVTPSLNLGSLSDRDPKLLYSLSRKIRFLRLWSIDFQFLLRLSSKQSSCFAFIANLAHTLTFSFSLLGLIRLISKKRQALVYLRDHNLFSLLCFFGRKFNGVNYIVEIHSVPAGFRRLDRMVKILNKSSGVICISHHILDKLVIAGLKVPSTVVHDGVDLARFNIEMSTDTAKQMLGWKIKKKIIGYAGRFKTNGKEKGIPDLIQASKYLVDLDVDFRFVGGPLSCVPEYKTLIAQLRLPESRFIFQDGVPIEQLPHVIAAFDVCTIPMPIDPHFLGASPLKLFEYGALGKPIVATRLPGVQEVLDDSCAILVDPGCPIDLAKGIRQVIGNPDYADRIGALCKSKILHYSWSARANQVLSFFVSARITL